jgi:hypothetical protein
VNTYLKKKIGMTPLTFEEMYTILTQIEACLNSRPLCVLSNDFESPAVLTPGHFLIAQAQCSLPDAKFEDIPENHLTRWELLQRAQQVFWHRWSKEYLHQLQQRSKWKGEGSWTPRIGDLVIVKEDNLPPLVWKIGVIEELFPGNDGITRVVIVRTPSGSYKRPLVKLLSYSCISHFLLCSMLPASSVSSSTVADLELLQDLPP